MRHAERYFKNGLLTENRGVLIKALVNALVTNKLSPKLSDDQIIEVFEQAIEMAELNKKKSVKDILKEALKGKKPESADEVISLLEKVNEVSSSLLSYNA